MKIAAFFLCERVWRDKYKLVHIENASITQLWPRPKPVKLMLYSCAVSDVGETGLRTFRHTGRKEGDREDMFSLDVKTEINPDSLKTDGISDLTILCIAGQRFTFKVEILELGISATWPLEVRPEDRPGA